MRGTSTSPTSAMDASSFILSPAAAGGLDREDVIRGGGGLREYSDGTIGNCFCADSVVDLGGHSRRSLTSSLAESPVTCDTTLELRDGELAERDSRLVCVSNLPMRLATL